VPVQVGDAERHEASSGALLISDDVEPRRIRKTPHHLVVRDDDICGATEQLAVRSPSGLEVSDTDPAEEDVDVCHFGLRRDRAHVVAG
jgi:hypothetical protein